MLSETIWWSSVLLEVLLLARGADARLRGRYPVFYTYLLFVLIQSPIRLVAYRYGQPTYRPVYWTTEFLALAMGCLVVFEIYKVALTAFPGAAKVARGLLLGLFALAAAKAVAAFWSDPHLLADATPLTIERALRTAQALAIVALVAAFAWYAIPFGRNLRGILLGYGFFVGERVICLAFVPTNRHDFWFYAYSASYPVALGLWLTHLWSYQAATETESGQLELGYPMVAATTQTRLQQTRGSLRKAVRP